MISELTSLEDTNYYLLLTINYHDDGDIGYQISPLQGTQGFTLTIIGDIRTDIIRGHRHYEGIAALRLNTCVTLKSGVLKVLSAFKNGFRSTPGSARSCLREEGELGGA